MSSQRPGPPPPLATYRPSNERGAPPQQPHRRGPPPPGGGRPRAPQPPRSSGGGFLRGLMYLFLLVLIVAGAGIGYLIVNPPSDLIRTTIAEQVKAKTGRDLIVAGPAAFSFYPGLGVTLKDVSLSGPPGSNGKLVTMAELDVNIKTMPLINRNVEVRRLIVRKPVFDLRVDKAGKKNWNFAELVDPRQYAQTAAPTATDAATDDQTSAHRGVALPKRLSDIDHLQMDDVRIEDGTVRFTDERSGKTQEVKAVNVNLALKSLQAPLTVDGDLAWQGEKIDFNAKLTSAKAILEEKPARLVFAAQNRLINSSFDGNVLIKDGADLEGQVTTKSASVRGIAKWLGTDLPPVAGFGPLSLAGTLKTNGNVTSLSNANFGLDGATATGTVAVTTGGVRPYVQANLKISELDLNKYMTTAAGGGGKAAPAVAPAPAPAQKSLKPAAGAPASGDAIENLLNEPKAKVYGYEQRSGWSSEPFNMALLGVADTDAKLQVGRLLFNNIKVGQSSLTVALKNRILKTSFDEVQMYEGHGKGFLNVDATGKAANIGANFALDGLAALPFLKDAAAMEWVSGTAKVGLQLAATGASQLQLVQALNGKADVKFNNGAIVGFNLPGAIRGISQGKFSGLKKAPTEKTDFSELGASFNIVNGVAQNQDLSMVSPLLRVTGAGAAQIPARTVDYTVKPKIVASLEGQQGAQALNGLEIPVRITGSWDKPNIEPDLKGILNDPNKALETVKEIGKQFKGKSANEIVDGLLGKKSGDGATGSTSGAKDLLNKFLKPQ
ncbi:MAG: AsmA family protein [Hyphomicrobium sp.]